MPAPPVPGLLIRRPARAISQSHDPRTRMTDPYQTLGVAKDASADDIRRAYRKLAKKHHPDLNPGNKAAEDTFKAVSAANDLLSDPEKTCAVRPW